MDFGCPCLGLGLVLVLVLVVVDRHRPGFSCPFSLSDLPLHTDSGTALYEGAWAGHEGVVKILLNHKADVNARGAGLNAEGGTYGNALQAAAAASGHENIVYSGPKLSDPADSFNAFKGISHKFATDCKPLINSLWGLPLFLARRCKSFTYALTWVHRAEDNLEGVRRRPSFPSYSFVGWEGKIYLEVQRNLEAKRGF